MADHFAESSLLQLCVSTTPQLTILDLWRYVTSPQASIAHSKNIWGCVTAVIDLDISRHLLNSCLEDAKIVCLFIVLSGQPSGSPGSPQRFLGRAQVTVSLPGTLDACGEDVRLLVNPSGLIEKQISGKQEPNNSQGS